ncbi:1626_t:CDS:1, partial [Acaulospora morrowiae]
NTQFKMEFPLTDITSIEYRSIDDIYSQIAVEVKDPPHFYMESSQGGWNLCKDFTEDKQATRHMRHVMKGRAVAMKPQLIKLMRDCPLLAKVVTILDAPEGNNNDADKQTNEQDQQQNPPRRSSFPSGSIADNLRFGDGICTPTQNDKQNNLLKQIARTRRSASVPVSPTEDKSPSLVSSTMTPNASLQVNTSTTFLDMYKAEANSSPEFCSSPMDLNSTSSPSTPLYVFDNSPTIMDSSPLLNQDPFVSLPAHNL